MTAGGRGILVETCLVWRLGPLSVCVDASTTGGGTVCVAAWIVWGRRCLSASDDVSLVYTASVVVLASTMPTLGWDVSSVCASVTTTVELGFGRGAGKTSLLGARRLKVGCS